MTCTLLLSATNNAPNEEMRGLRPALLPGDNGGLLIEGYEEAEQWPQVANDGVRILVELNLTTTIFYIYNIVFLLPRAARHTPLDCIFFRGMMIRC
jgi:hypothetical protein